jgi:hypothetical protein
MRMDDTNGTFFYDRSSYGNNATINGSVVTNSTNGIFGNGSRFNAASNLIAVCIGSNYWWYANMSVTNLAPGCYFAVNNYYFYYLLCFCFKLL